MTAVQKYLPNISTMQVFADGSGFWLSAILPTAVVTGFWHVYHSVVTRPLQYFYFVGPIWGNIPPQEMCNSMTDNKLGGEFWLRNMPDCLDMLNRKFVSWDTTVVTTLYFFTLAFTVAHVAKNCCFIPNIFRFVCGTRSRRKDD